MILSINAGSSSIKFALFRQDGGPEKLASGQISRIGLAGAALHFTMLKTGEKQNVLVPGPGYPAAIDLLMKTLEREIDFSGMKAIGHRVVHGMQHTMPAQINAQLLKDLRQIISFDPDHLPNELRLIEAFSKYHPGIPQFACFDTGFHHSMPRVAKLMAIPRRFDRLGIQRYGFHGLSYQYLMQELEKLAGAEKAGSRVILAHLGNGASLAAVFRGQSVDTSMGFTPGAGIPMSSRSGDLDPGVAWFMMKSENPGPEQFNRLVMGESGLLGISETTGDMKDLLLQEKTDFRSAEAVDLFCYQVKKWIGAFAAALGGLDTLVFAGGIGESSPEIRTRICAGLSFLGVEIDESLNRKNADVISAGEDAVNIRVIHTDEEWMIAKIVSGMINHNK